MTYDQMIDQGEAMERDEWLADAAAQVEAQVESAVAGDAMANGDVCYECGEAFLDRQGRPTVCTDCGGSAPTRVLHPVVDVAPASSASSVAPSWFHTSDGRYFASESDRRAHQRSLDEKAARLAERMARVNAARQTVELSGDLLAQIDHFHALRAEWTESFAAGNDAALPTLAGQQDATALEIADALTAQLRYRRRDVAA